MMNQYLKRIITAVCTLAMLLTIAAPAFAIEDVADVPVLDVSASEISIEAIAPAAAEPAAVPIAELQNDSTTQAKITVETVELKTKFEAETTKEVAVKLSISDNPGITGARLQVSFAEGMTLKAITRGDALSGLDFTLPGQFDSSVTVTDPVTSPIHLVWDGVSREPDTTNGVLATLTFEVPTAAAGTYAVSVTADAEDIYEGSSEDNTLKNVAVDFVAGGITVVERTYIPGDIDGDTFVGNNDAIRLLQYLVGWDVVVVEEALDVDGDGFVSNNDAIRLLQYIVGWGVEIH